MNQEFQIHKLPFCIIFYLLTLHETQSLYGKAFLEVSCRGAVPAIWTVEHYLEATWFGAKASHLPSFGLLLGCTIQAWY